MILVDSSVWIDYFRGNATRQVAQLDRLLGHELVAIGDLNLAEILQGFRRQRDFNQAKKLLLTLEVVDIGGVEIAIQAASNFRQLRSLGVTIRKTVDTLIATRCIESHYALLYSDRDFQPFVEHLGLQAA